jgi:hypothetical protein
LEHDADRSRPRGRAAEEGSQPAAIDPDPVSLREPVDAHGELLEAGDHDRLLVNVARERAEAELRQAPSRRGRAAVPRRSEDRRDEVAKELAQTPGARRDVAPLLRLASARPELALSPARLVVHVAEAVLVDDEPPPEQLRGQLRLQGRGDDRHVERDGVALEDVEELEQAAVRQAGVVVAEEKSGRGRGRVECAAKRTESAAAGHPARTASAVATMRSMRSGQSGTSRWNGCGARVTITAARYHSSAGGRSP